MEASFVLGSIEKLSCGRSLCEDLAGTCAEILSELRAELTPELCVEVLQQGSGEVLMCACVLLGYVRQVVCRESAPCYSG